MISSVLTCGAILLGATAPDGPATDRPEREAYDTAAAAAGHDAAAHVRLALWCEARGLTAERLEHLSRAVVDQPSNALARGLLGFVRHQGRWERPEVVAGRARDDADRQALTREYLQRRAQAAGTPDAQAELAAWCESKGLKEQALAHYHEVLRLDPSRSIAWRHLGYIKQGSRWVRPEQLADAKQEAIRQKQADRSWRTKLAKLRDDLQGKDAAKRSRAEQALSEVTDPRAVSAIWVVFVAGGERSQRIAIGMFGQIDGPSASGALAALAVLSPWPEVRAQATEMLTRRDPRDVAGRLIDLVHKPYKYEVRPVGGPGSPGELFVEGERFNIQRLYESQTTGSMLVSGARRFYTSDVPFDPFSPQNLMMATGAWAANLLNLTPKGVAASPLAPLNPLAAAQAANRMAADPRNAAGAMAELMTDPNNRVVPPGYSFTPSGPLAPQIQLGTPTRTTRGAPSSLTPTPAERQAAEAFGRQLRAQGNDPLSLWGMALQLQSLEYGRPEAQAATAGALAVQTQAQFAAQRDIEIGLDLARVQQSNQNLQQRLAMDVQFIERTNEGIGQTNARVLPVLKAITGLDLGIDREKWKSWWMDQLDESPGSRGPRAKPTLREYVTDATGMSNPAAVSAVPERGPTSTDAAYGPDAAVPVRACFAAGTPVQSVDGLRPIESLHVGDAVLCQDLRTGALEYQPVLASHRNKPAPALRITAGGETIVATGLQRFWKPGKGWTMARDLRVGDRLRVVGGVVDVASIEEVPSQPVYNVDVAEDGDLFVGGKSFLVHDFGFVPSVHEPFDRHPELTATLAKPQPTRSTGRLGSKGRKAGP